METITKQLRVDVREVGMRRHLVPVTSLEEASKVCRAFICEFWLGASQWAGGCVYDAACKKVATVSYNGRVWGANGEEVIL